MMIAGYVSDDEEAQMVEDVVRGFFVNKRIHKIAKGLNE